MEGSQSTGKSLSTLSCYISSCIHRKIHTFYWYFNIHDYLSVDKIVRDILFYKPIEGLLFQYSVYLCQHNLQWKETFSYLWDNQQYRKDEIDQNIIREHLQKFLWEPPNLEA